MSQSYSIGVLRFDCRGGLDAVFWISTVLTVLTIVLEMAAYFPGLNLHYYISPKLVIWIQTCTTSAFLFSRTLSLSATSDYLRFLIKHS